jgi:small-conductance mechanosensitive channel
MTAQRDLISAGVMMVTTLIFFWASLAIEEDPFGTGLQPYVFPQAILYIQAALTLIMLAGAVTRFRREGVSTEKSNELKIFVFWVLPMAAIAFFYLGLINLFQYLLPTILALSACLAIFGNRGVKWLVVIPVIAAIFYYFIFFGIFRLLEPTGMLLEYDNYYLFGPMQKFLRV